MRRNQLVWATLVIAALAVFVWEWPIGREAMPISDPEANVGKVHAAPDEQPARSEIARQSAEAGAGGEHREPVAASRRSEADWQSGDPGILLRLVYGSGLPCSNLSGRAFEERHTPRLEFDTDDDGKVHWTRNDLSLSLRPPKKLLLECSAAGELGTGRIAPIVLEFPETWPDIAYNFGTVVVTERGLLVEGRVSTRSGVPIDGASVNLYQRSPGRPWLTAQDIAGALNPPFLPSAFTDEKGYFSLYGTIAPLDSMLRVGAVDCVGEEIELPPGPPWSFFDFLLDPAAQIEGRVLVDDDIPAHRLGVYLGEPADLFTAPYHLGMDGKFRVFGLRSGSVDVFLTARYVFTIPWKSSARLVAGEVLTLPDLDLRGRLQLWYIVVLDENGSLVPRELVLATDLEGTRGYGSVERSLDGREGGITIVAERDAVLDVRIFASGYEPEIITMSRSNPKATVVLRALH